MSISALRQPPEPDAPVIVLLHPTITHRSDVTDEQHEGCLRFFDVRGLVPRPLRIIVRTVTLDGNARSTDHECGLARLIHHEIGHLTGHPYTAGMRPGVQRSTGRRQ
jgi:peptide deformylase